MKIVRIIARLNVGGPARHVVWLTEALQNDEFTSVLIAGSVPEGEQSMEYLAAEHSVAPIYIREMSRELSLKDAVSLWKIFTVLRRERPDIIHTHTAKAGTVGRLSGLAYKMLFNRKVKLIHTYHGHVFHSYYGSLKTAFFRAIEKLLAAFATDRIIAITEQQKEEINVTFGVGRGEQFSIVPLGIDLERFKDSAEARARFRSELGVGEGQIAVGFVGRLTEIKNLKMLIDAAMVVTRAHPGRYKFVVIGDGNLRADLEAYADSCGLGSDIVFTGNREDAETFYTGIDIVALTSLNEGTPLSLIEGMAARRPVIATSVGGIPDLVGNLSSKGDGFEVHERGVTAASGDVRGFAAGLVRLASDRQLRESLVSSAFVFVTGRYGKERLIAQIADLYRGIHGSNP